MYVALPYTFLFVCVVRLFPRLEHAASLLVAVIPALMRKKFQVDIDKFVIIVLLNLCWATFNNISTDIMSFYRVNIPAFNIYPELAITTTIPMCSSSISC